jgi:AraC-like DNA-binding protein
MRQRKSRKGECHLATQYTAFDFISSDLVITSIKNIYWSEVYNWSRPNPLPRYANGLVLVTGGRIDYVFGGEEITGQKGDVLLFPKDIPYSGKKYGEEPNSYYVIDFDTETGEECVRFPLPLSFRVSNFKMVEEAFSAVLRQWMNKDTASRLKCRAKIYSLLALLAEDYSRRSIYAGNMETLTDILEYISMNFTNPQLNVKKICKTFYVSESQLRRMFQKAFNKSPLAYIQAMRLDLARSMLSGESGSVPMEEVAYSCGFSSLPYFSRLFKKYTGVPPSQYNRMTDASRN